MNKVIQGLERVMVSLTLLAVILVCTNIYFTIDRRQAQFEAKVTASLDGLGSNATSKLDALTAEVHGELAPVSASLVVLLSTINGQVSRLDVSGLNNQLSSNSSAVLKATDGLAAAGMSLNETLRQVNEALPFILDCDPAHAGADCLPNRYLEIAGETESALKSISAAAPSIASSVRTAAATVAAELPKITANVAGITDDAHEITTDASKLVKTYTTPPTRLQKLGAFGKTALYVVVHALL